MPNTLNCGSRTEVSNDVKNLAVLGLFETIENKYYDRLSWCERLVDFTTHSLKHWLIDKPFYQDGEMQYMLVFYHTPFECWDRMIIPDYTVEHVHPLPRRLLFDNLE